MTNPNGRYPVIYWLHGAYHSRPASRLPSLHVLVKSPNLSGYVDSRDGKNRVETVIVKDLTARVDATYRTIPLAKAAPSTDNP